MKNIQKYLSALLALAMAAPVFTGCSDDYEYSLSSVVAKPSDKFNARIQFVSRLSDGALITGDADHEMLIKKLKALKIETILLTWDVEENSSTSGLLKDEACIHLEISKLLAEDRNLLKRLCQAG